MYFNLWAPSTTKSYSSKNDSSDQLDSPDSHITLASEFRKFRKPLKGREIEIEARGFPGALSNLEITRKVSHKEWISRLRALDKLNEQISDAEKNDRTAVLMDVEDLKELREEFEFLHKGVTELVRLTDDVKQIAIAKKQFASDRTKELTKDETSKMLIDRRSRIFS
ncbi:17966_t:CDS:2 [Acaulospora morrowiae]|uniref:17966_t:CDS:1 n=1 Tax=Acaulospora morrowiae TaxID=94023 RepID=A0A9N9GIN9_9GLOM|nr:17966_t:CDS:2 [Acaulospora morrowiae]